MTLLQKLHPKAGKKAEFRIPLSTLRYPKTYPQTWNILIWRNWPRDFDTHFTVRRLSAVRHATFVTLIR